MSNEGNGSGWDVSSILNRMTLLHTPVREHGFEPFVELAQEDPAQAIKEFPKTLERVLGAGNNFFKGIMCGGPHPAATVPLLNAIGGVYADVPREVRLSGLHQVFGFLDGLNYLNAQDNVELIQEPWLVGDILVNCSLYWPGFKPYVDRLEGVVTWDGFEQEFLKQHDEDSRYLDAPSTFWLAYAVARKDCSGSSEVRQVFSEVFPEVMDRTKDVAAALVADHSLLDELNPEKGIPYEQGVGERLGGEYEDSWHEDLVRRIGEEKWMYTSGRLQEIPELCSFEQASSLA